MEEFLRKDNIFYKKVVDMPDGTFKGSFELPRYTTTYRIRLTSYDENGVYG